MQCQLTSYWMPCNKYSILPTVWMHYVMTNEKQVAYLIEQKSPNFNVIICIICSLLFIVKLIENTIFAYLLISCIQKMCIFCNSENSMLVCYSKHSRCIVGFLAQCVNLAVLDYWFLYPPLELMFALNSNKSRFTELILEPL